MYEMNDSFNNNNNNSITRAAVIGIRFNDGDQKVIVDPKHNLPSWPQMISHLCEDSKRNDMLADIVAGLCFSGRRVLVLSARVKHCETLHTLLRKKKNTTIAQPIRDGLRLWEFPVECVVDDIIEMYVVSVLFKQHNTRCQDNMQNGKQTLCYNFEKQGHDFDYSAYDCAIGTKSILKSNSCLSNFDTIVLACPFSDENIHACISRTRNNKHTLVVDIMDGFSVFPNHSRKRVHMYVSI